MISGTSLRSSLTIIVLAGVAVCSSAACQSADDTESPETTDASQITQPDNTSSGGAKCSQCPTFPNSAPVITPICIGGAMPTPAGGAMPKPGFYYRTRSELYGDCSGATLAPEQETNLICGGYIQWQALSAVSTAAAQLTLSGSSVTLALTCPITASLTFGYEATANGYKIFDPSAGTVHIFTRK